MLRRAFRHFADRRREEVVKRPPTTRAILKRLTEAAHAYDNEFFACGALDDQSEAQSRTVGRLYAALDAADEHLAATARKRAKCVHAIGKKP